MDEQQTIIAKQDELMDVATANTLLVILEALIETRAQARAELRTARNNLAEFPNPSTAQRYTEGVMQGKVDGITDAIDEVRHAIGALTISGGYVSTLCARKDRKAIT